ncbi:DUF2335 domain-containing protein [Moraxella pluranimalium]|uniref:DUF2335 domain-containing protein n=1 Tax=Moraxella pluranimalium TaxID=470453 RepID=A0A1T0CQM9_9GAMM|nr:DUF2335 domain-containing protein [Moraxella pluranimalium]OOS24647.1 hypothetical protein B0680_04260 [Moraxella pluranimalium]
MSQKQRKGTRVQATQDERGLQAQFEQVEEYSPYPPAEFLHELNKIDPKYVEQVMQMAKSEQEQRHKLQDSQLSEAIRVNTALMDFDKQNIVLMQRGQWFGLVLGVGLLVIAGVALYYAQAVVAGIAITAIIGILIVYVLRQQPKNSPSNQ